MCAMKKFFSFFLWLLVPLSSISQRCDSIEWSKHHPLKWKNFKGKPDKKSTATAVSEPHIFYELRTLGNQATFRFSCSFSTCHSWVKGKGTKNLLQHEQTHFDIAAYYKKVLIKEILSNKYAVSDVVFRVNDIHRQVSQLRKQADELYDLETHHSINVTQQKAWTRKIRRLIRKLKGYDRLNYSFQLYS